MALNDKIILYRAAFYGKRPKYEQGFEMKQENELLKEKQQVKKNSWKRKMRKQIVGQMNHLTQSMFHSS